MRQSKAIANIVEANRRGYWVGDDGEVHAPRGKIRRCNIDDAGFKRFSLWQRGDTRTRLCVYVHKLAAYQVYGDQIRNEQLRITFRNRNRLDCRPSNVILRTHSQIQRALPQAERIAFGMNAARRLRKLTDADLGEFRAMRLAGATLRALSDRFGIAVSTASYIVNGLTYT